MLPNCFVDAVTIPYHKFNFIEGDVSERNTPWRILELSALPPMTDASHASA